MKGKNLIHIILSVLIFLLLAPAVAQNKNGSIYNSTEDSINCGKNLSAYRTFFRLKLYEDAYETWWAAFNKCPAASERMYLDGVTMYRSFIEAAPDGPVREGLIDTLMLIYDQRMENFGNEGNVLGRKGRDLLNYRKSDIIEVQNAYEMLKKSIELQGKKSQEAVMVLFSSAGIALNKEGIIDDNQVIENYLMLFGILNQIEGTSSRWERTRTTIDENLLNGDILSCEALNQYYEPVFEENKNDLSFLEMVIKLYKIAGCDRSNIYVAALEKMYISEPGPESAHNLAILFITRNDYKKAAIYLKEAVQGVNIDSETKAEWFYELAVVSNATGDYCDAISYAREAISQRGDYGKAYILLGDAFIASRVNLGDDFKQRTAFWAAADMYQKAASVDPSISEESGQKLTDYLGQYPNDEEVFFRDLKNGDSYLVGGCINEYSTVRSGK